MDQRPGSRSFLVRQINAMSGLMRISVHQREHYCSSMQAMQLHELQQQYLQSKQALKRQLAEAEAALLAPHRSSLTAGMLSPASWLDTRRRPIRADPIIQVINRKCCGHPHLVLQI